MPRRGRNPKAKDKDGRKQKGQEQQSHGPASDIELAFRNRTPIAQRAADTHGGGQISGKQTYRPALPERTWTEGEAPPPPVRQRQHRGGKRQAQVQPKGDAVIIMPLVANPVVVPVITADRPGDVYAMPHHPPTSGTPGVYLTPLSAAAEGTYAAPIPNGIQTVPGHGGGYVVPASAGYQQTQGGTGPEYVQPEPFLRAGDQDTYVTPVRNGTQAAPEYVYTHDPRGTQFSGHRPPVQETHMGPAVVTPRERAESTESDKSRESEESEESKISQGTQSSGSEVVTDDSGLGPITQGDVKGKKKKSSSALQKAEEDLSTLKKAEEDLSAQPAVEFILRLLKVRDYKRKAVKVAYDMQQKLDSPQVSRLCYLLTKAADSPKSITLDEIDELAQLLPIAGFGVERKTFSRELLVNAGYVKVGDEPAPDVMAEYLDVQEEKNEFEEQDFDTVVFVSDLPPAQVLNYQTATEGPQLVYDEVVEDSYITYEQARSGYAGQKLYVMGTGNLHHPHTPLKEGSFRIFRAREVKNEQAVYEIVAAEAAEAVKVEYAEAQANGGLYDMATASSSEADVVAVEASAVYAMATSSAPKAEVVALETPGFYDMATQAAEEEGLYNLASPSSGPDGASSEEFNGPQAFEEEGLYAADTVPAEFRLSRKGGAESPEYGFDVEAELEPDKLEIVPLRRTRTKGLTLEGGTQLQREARDSMSSPTGEDGEYLHVDVSSSDEGEQAVLASRPKSKKKLHVLAKRPAAELPKPPPLTRHLFHSIIRPPSAKKSDLLPVQQQDGTTSFLVPVALYEEVTTLTRDLVQRAAAAREAHKAEAARKAQEAAIAQLAQAAVFAQKAQSFKKGGYDMEEMYASVEDAQFYSLDLIAHKSLTDSQARFIYELLKLLKNEIPNPYNILERNPGKTIAAAVAIIVGGAVGGYLGGGSSGGGGGDDVVNPTSNATLAPSLTGVPVIDECVADAVNGTFNYFCLVAIAAVHNVTANATDHAMTHEELIEAHGRVQQAQYLIAAGLGDIEPANATQYNAFLMELQRCNDTIAEQLCLPHGLQDAHMLAIPAVEVGGLQVNGIEDFKVPATQVVNITASGGNVTSVTFTNLTGLQLYLGATPVPVAESGLITIPYASLSSYSFGMPEHAHGNASVAYFASVSGPGGAVNSTTVESTLHFESQADQVILQSARLAGTENGRIPLNFSFTDIGGDNLTHIRLSGVVHGDIYAANGARLGRGVVTIPREALDGAYFEPDAGWNGLQTWTRTAFSRDPSGNDVASISDTVEVGVGNLVAPAQVSATVVETDEDALQAAALNLSSTAIPVPPDNVTLVRLLNVSHGDIIASNGTNLGRGDVVVTAEYLSQGVGFRADPDFYTPPGQPLVFTKEVVTEYEGQTAVANGTVTITVHNTADQAIVQHDVYAGREEFDIAINSTARALAPDNISQVVYEGVSHGVFVAHNGTILGNGTVVIDGPTWAQGVTFRADDNYFGNQTWTMRVTTRDARGGTQTITTNATMTVANRADQAAAQAQRVSGVEDSSWIGMNVTDQAQDGDFISNITYLNVTHGDIVLSNGTNLGRGMVELDAAAIAQGFGFTPDPNFQGTVVMPRIITTQDAYGGTQTVQSQTILNVTNRVDNATIAFGQTTCLEGQSCYLNLTATPLDPDDFYSMVLDDFNGTVTVNGTDYVAGETIPLSGKIFPQVRRNPVSPTAHGVEQFRVSITTVDQDGVTTTAHDFASVVTQNVVGEADITVGGTTTLLENADYTGLGINATLQPGDHYLYGSVEFTGGHVRYQGNLYNSGQNITLNGAVLPGEFEFKPNAGVHGNQTMTVSFTTGDDYGRFTTATATKSLSITPVAGGLNYNGTTAESVVSGNWATFDTAAATQEANEFVTRRLLSGIESGVQVRREISPGSDTWASVPVSAGTAELPGGTGRWGLFANTARTLNINMSGCSNFGAAVEECNHTSVGISALWTVPTTVAPTTVAPTPPPTPPPTTAAPTPATPAPPPPCTGRGCGRRDVGEDKSFLEQVVEAASRMSGFGR